MTLEMAGKMNTCKARAPNQYKMKLSIEKLPR